MFLVMLSLFFYSYIYRMVILFFCFVSSLNLFLIFSLLFIQFVLCLLVVCAVTAELHFIVHLTVLLSVCECWGPP